MKTGCPKRLLLVLGFGLSPLLGISQAGGDQLSLGSNALPQGALSESTIEALPGTKPLIKRTDRPANYETPMEYFSEDFTSSDRFFVRRHLVNVPEIKPTEWKLKIGGDAVKKPQSFSISELKRHFRQVEVAALAYCAGNRRGIFKSHVPGVQWSFGAMGNAVWKGVRLKDVLAKAGMTEQGIEVILDGADSPTLDKTPDFRKSIPLSKALDENTLIAFEMNGRPLSKNQGYPARVVIPGWAATYWIKQVVSVEVTSKPFDGYWMKTAYRIPKGRFKAVEADWPSQETETSKPVTEIAINSVISSPLEGQKFERGQKIDLKGFAWDGGHGIAKVEVSVDGGKTWSDASLGKDYGRFSWRPFSFQFVAGAPGGQTLLARATNSSGHQQVSEEIPNTGGYHHNVPQPVKIIIEEVGKTRVISQCIICHSLDYIVMNSRFLDRSGWEKTVNKMIQAMGAPIDSKDVPEIVDYLTTHYGVQK